MPIQSTELYTVTAWFALESTTLILGFPGGSMVKKKKKNPPANAGDTEDTGSIPGLGRSPGGGNDNPLQYSCLEKSMDREPGRL